MTKGNKYLLGKDVVMSAGSEAIIQLQDSGDAVNEIYFDSSPLSKEEREDPAIINFKDYAQRDGSIDRPRDENGFYLVDGVRVHLKKPENIEEIIGMSNHPDLIEEYHETGFKDVQRPKFLLQDPEILDLGLIEKSYKDFEDSKVSSLRPQDIDNKIPMNEGVNLFELDPEKSFINQFILLTLEGGEQTLYQLKQDCEHKGKGKYNYKGEPHYIRIESQIKNFRDKNQFKESKTFGITPNDIRQYIALKYLLMDPTIELVILSGGPGTGKTLLPYVAGLEQTLMSEKDSKSRYPGGIFLSKPLTEAGDEQVGFLPGDLDDKLGPLYECFSGIHDDFTDLAEYYLFKDCISKGNAQKLKRANLYLPNEKKPLVKMKNSAYMRGVNIPDGFIILDEVQNFTRHIMKLLLTRGSSGTKTVLCGDIGQIDNYPINSPQRNGLVFASHYHLREGHPHVGIMNFTQPNRNYIANSSMNMPNYYKN